jgi:iron complex transport system permease protein
MQLDYGIDRKRILFPILALLLVIFFLLDLFLGSTAIPFNEIIKSLFGSASKPEWNLIVTDFRLPKALAAIFAGIALSVSGLQMQVIFRNPLAGPDVLGISSGASLGVALVVLSVSSFVPVTFLTFSGSWIVVFAACAGAGATMAIILTVSARVKDMLTVLILGIMIGAAFSSIVSILQYFGNETLLKSFIVWTLGSLGHISWEQLEVMIPIICIGIILSLFLTKRLNALLIGEKYAQSLGVNVKTTRLLVFTSTSLLAGSVTAFCGPIAFVAIAVPHLCRMIFKTSDNFILLFSSVMVGAITLLISDIISQLPGSSLTLPINSVTSLLGIPIVVWIIVRNTNKHNW